MVSLGLSSFRSILILLLLLIFFDLIVAQPSYLSHFCLGDRDTTNSTFKSNLDSLLSSLSTREGVSRGSKGLSQDGVYVLLQCSGYVSSDICQKCVDSAIRDILKHCPNRKESIIWYNECMLRYSDQSFFSIMQVNPGGNNSSKIGDVSDTVRFNQMRLQLMYGLVTEAAYGSSNTKLFAMSRINFMSSQYIYGTAQCTVDISASDCTICLNGAIADISGRSRQGGVVYRPSCFLRYETYPFYEIGATSQPTQPTNGNKNTIKIIVIVIPSVAAASMFAFAFFTFLLRRKAMSWRKVLFVLSNFKPNGGYNPLLFLLGKISKHQWFHWKNAQGKSVKVPNSADVPFVDFETILAATDNFSNSNKLGQGGFGPVYKGKFQGGQELAVKRLSRSSGQGSDEFKNEVLLIAKLQHRNLVRLLGYCIKGDEKILLYEYMPNKSLDSFIFDQTLCLLLNWEKRYNIIMGIARGVLYLHQDSRLRIIHRDLKTSNILLDEDMNPKISDFGMARIFGGTQTQGNTNKVVGTYGYMSPEYALDGLFSVKSDVYSFGVVLLEILSGKKNTSFYESEDNFSLIRYAWRLWDENKALDFIDSSFREAYDTGEVLKCIHVGLLCVQEDPKDRPTMSTVLFMLGGETTSPPTPKQPALVFRRTQPITIAGSSKTETCSRNEMTISDVKGR